MSEQKSSQQLAVEKLQDELKKAKNKAFAEPIIEHLIKRCGEDQGFADDVLNEKKTWEKCDRYIYDQARKAAGNARSLAVRNDQVFEWAEDFYRLDEKAMEEFDKKPAPKTIAPKVLKATSEKKNTQRSTKPVDTGVKNMSTETKPAPKKEEKKEDPKPKVKKAEPKKKQEDISGQMTLFDLM